MRGLASIFLPLLLTTCHAVPAYGYAFLLGGAYGKRTEPFQYYTNSPNNCQPGVLEQVFDWMEVYDILLPIDVVWAGWTMDGVQDDDKSVIFCETFFNITNKWQLNHLTQGFVRYTTFNGRPTGSDLILLQHLPYDNGCAIPHEVGHVFGLDHSDAANSVMRAQNCFSEWLWPDDLVGLANLYDVPANCSGYVTRDLDIFIPYFKGQWILLQHQGDLLYYLQDVGESIEYDWQCNQVVSEGKATFDIIFKGGLYSITLEQHGEYLSVVETSY